MNPVSGNVNHYETSLAHLRRRGHVGYAADSDVKVSVFYPAEEATGDLLESVGSGLVGRVRQ